MAKRRKQNTRKHDVPGPSRRKLPKKIIAISKIKQEHHVDSPPGHEGK